MELKHGWNDTVAVDTVSDRGVKTCIYAVDGIPEHISVIGSTYGQGSHGAVREALARVGLATQDDLGGWLWEAGEVFGEEVVYVKQSALEPWPYG